MIFKGLNRVRYPYSRYGWTRNNGKTWHGGIDIEGIDDTIILMPTYKNNDGSEREISGTVTRARIVTDKSNRTWEWGYYVCVKLDDNQTPDYVNFMYFCHCKQLLVKAGDRVKSGDKLAIMGNTGNAAYANPPYAHCHFEVRKTATSTGLNPTRYCGFVNEVGTYGTKPTEPTKPTNQSQIITIAGVNNIKATQIYNFCKQLKLTNMGLYRSKYTNVEKTIQTITIGPVSNGDANSIYQLCKQIGIVDAGQYSSRYV